MSKQMYWPIELKNGTEVVATVHYDFQPPERATLTYPGCNADAEICAVFAEIDGVVTNITNWLDEDKMESLRVEALDREMEPEDER